ncbi:serine protease [Glutamicibacter sp. 0426]|uniref:S1 family peptidase n=1 Tax=Glutamicibacter sp. 0426 TaxID=1913445 RepID=UPI00093F99F5|nr:serine protease [Glutamicibacter sp. 0426]
MEYENLVVPLMAFPSGENKEPLGGSGFLVTCNGEKYLVTAAHLANHQLAPSSDWSLWSNELILVDQSIRPVEIYQLFYEGHKGKRVPRFKYYLREDRENSIADLILVPVENSSVIARTYESFDLDQEMGSYEPDIEVLMLGRPTEGFPALSVVSHTTKDAHGPLRFMAPDAAEGNSGGPAISLSGELLGMNVGSHVQRPNEAMLMSPESIRSLTQAQRGKADEWPKF